MCLSTVYYTHNQRREAICKNIVGARNEGKAWVFTDLLGREIKISATLESVNLVDGYINLKEENFMLKNVFREV